MTDVLVVGINSDQDILMNKGPSVMNVFEKQEILSHCKFIDEIVINTPYSPSFELLEQLNCSHFAHGDDPAINCDGVDITDQFREKGMLKTFKRTEVVSTTDITGKLLALAEHSEMQSRDQDYQSCSPALKQIMEPPRQQFLATTRRVINFANKNLPGPDDVIVYIQGSFDLLHHGHLKRLQMAKQLGTFLYVGIWDDEMVRYYKGEHYPILSVHERVLMTLASKDVDDIVIGAPYIITKDLIKSLGI